MRPSLAFVALITLTNAYVVMQLATDHVYYYYYLTEWPDLGPKWVKLALFKISVKFISPMQNILKYTFQKSDRFAKSMTIFQKV